MGCCSSDEIPKRRYPTQDEVRERKEQELAEVKDMIDEMFDRYDTAHKGRLNREQLIEMVVALSAESRGMDRQRAEKYIDFLLRKADKDQDGLISKSEFF